MAKKPQSGGLSIPKREAAADSVVTYLESVVRDDADVYRYLPVGDIALNPANDYNQYDDEASIAALAGDIARNGLLHNIVVSQRADGGLLLLSGERRLRAYRVLQADDRRGKYDKIFAKIRTNLTADEEVIIMDAANLMARGGIENEHKRRLASARFVASIQARFPEVGCEEAVRIAASITGTSARLLSENIELETALLPEIRALLNAGLMNKDDALLLAAAPEEYQRAYVDLSARLASAGAGEGPPDLIAVGSGPVSGVGVAVRDDGEDGRALRAAVAELTAAFIQSARETENVKKALKKYDELIEKTELLLRTAAGDAERGRLEKQLALLRGQREEKAREAGRALEKLTAKAAGEETPRQRLARQAAKNALSLAKTAQRLGRPQVLDSLEGAERRSVLADVREALEVLQAVEVRLGDG